MEFLAGFGVVLAVTVIATWFNDNISKGEYINDEAA
jgi:hypothetical protein